MITKMQPIPEMNSKKFVLILSSDESDRYDEEVFVVFVKFVILDIIRCFANSSKSLRNWILEEEVFVDCNCIFCE